MGPERSRTRRELGRERGGGGVSDGDQVRCRGCRVKISSRARAWDGRGCAEATSDVFWARERRTFVQNERGLHGECGELSPNCGTRGDPRGSWARWEARPSGDGSARRRQAERRRSCMAYREMKCADGGYVRRSSGGTCVSGRDARTAGLATGSAVRARRCGRVRRRGGGGGEGGDGDGDGGRREGASTDHCLHCRAPVERPTWLSRDTSVVV